MQIGCSFLGLWVDCRHDAIWDSRRNAGLNVETVLEGAVQEQRKICLWLESRKLDTFGQHHQKGDVGKKEHYVLLLIRLSCNTQNISQERANVAAYSLIVSALRAPINEVIIINDINHRRCISSIIKWRMTMCFLPHLAKSYSMSSLCN